MIRHDGKPNKRLIASSRSFMGGRIETVSVGYLLIISGLPSGVDPEGRLPRLPMVGAAIMFTIVDPRQAMAQ
jgi:hypothetical protein